MRCVCSHVHTRTRVNSCVCVCVRVVGEVGGRSNRSRTRTIPTTRTQSRTRTRTEPNRTAPNHIVPIEKKWHSTNRCQPVDFKASAGRGLWPQQQQQQQQEQQLWLRNTHTHTRVGIGTHAHTVKWHVHTYLNMMRNFNFPWLIHMIFDCHIHIVVNLVNLSLDPNSGWLFRLDFMARRPRSGYHIWFIIIVLMLPMCDCNVNQLKTHFVIFVSLSTNALQMFKCNSI